MSKIIASALLAASLLVPGLASAEDRATTTIVREPTSQPQARDGRSCEGPCECDEGEVGHKAWMENNCYCVCELESEQERTVH